MTQYKNNISNSKYNIFDLILVNTPYCVFDESRIPLSTIDPGPPPVVYPHPYNLAFDWPKTLKYHSSPTIHNYFKAD